VVDIDSDGIQDILMGIDAQEIMYYSGSDQGDSVPWLSSQGFLCSETQMIQVYQASPSLLDYDLDGVHDLVTGTGSGKIYVFLNKGTPESYCFEDEHIELEDENGVIDLGFYTSITVYDLDDDGLQDIIAGCHSDGSGYLYWLRRNGPGSPFPFQSPQPLCFLGDSAIVHESGIYPGVGDLNSDGVPELIVGEYYGETFIYNGISTGIQGGYHSTVSPLFLVRTNPAAGILVLETGSPGDIAVYDCAGRRMLQVNDTSEGIASIDVTSLPAGVYTVAHFSAYGESRALFTVVR
jgi:hypothetical protein